MAAPCRQRCPKAAIYPGDYLSCAGPVVGKRCAPGPTLDERAGGSRGIPCIVHDACQSVRALCNVRDMRGGFRWVERESPCPWGPESGDVRMQAMEARAVTRPLRPACSPSAMLVGGFLSISGQVLAQNRHRPAGPPRGSSVAKALGPRWGAGGEWWISCGLRCEQCAADLSHALRFPGPSFFHDAAPRSPPASPHF